jgi:acetyltransferase-like isoleucine patch superfamily enzyme
MFIDSNRNNALRKQILTYSMSSVMTDDERAKLLGLPKGCRIRENAKILCPENFRCGEYVWIGEGAILDASGGLEIGDHTSIGLYVLVWTHTSYMANVTFGNKIGSELIERKPTKIGRGCFVAGHSVIYSGVTIGDRTVILPMTVVTKDVPGNCIIAGSPASKIRDLTDEDIEKEVERIMMSRRQAPS